MKKFRDLPFYFILFGLILNIIMYIYHPVTFTSLMIRSSIVIIISAVMGYIMAYVLNEAHTYLSNSSIEKQDIDEQDIDTASTIDIRIDQEEDDELFNFSPQSDNEDFIEIDPESFKKFMNQDT